MFQWVTEIVCSSREGACGVHLAFKKGHDAKISCHIWRLVYGNTWKQRCKQPFWVHTFGENKEQKVSSWKAYNETSWDSTNGPHHTFFQSNCTYEKKFSFVCACFGNCIEHKWLYCIQWKRVNSKQCLSISKNRQRKYVGYDAL